MVKIEQLKNGAKATFVRDGTERPIFLHQLITRQELETLMVQQGTVVYSVDEMEILEKSADVKSVAAPAPQPVEPAAPAQERKLTAKEIAAQAKIAAKKQAMEQQQQQ